MTTEVKRNHKRFTNKETKSIKRDWANSIHPTYKAFAIEKAAEYGRTVSSIIVFLSKEFDSKKSGTIYKKSGGNRSEQIKKVDHLLHNLPEEVLPEEKEPQIEVRPIIDRVSISGQIKVNIESSSFKLDKTVNNIEIVDNIIYINLK